MPPLLSRNVGEFYNGKETLPVFDWNPKAKTPIEIFHILMKPAEDLTTCKCVPSLISHNACFLGCEKPCVKKRLEVRRYGVVEE